MRSVYFYIRNPDRLALEAFLIASCSARAERRYGWFVGDPEKPILLVGVTNDVEDDEPENLESARARVGGDVDTMVFVDVSGRHPGRPEVMGLARQMLSKFDAVVQDDESPYSWKLEELDQVNAKGRRFFDF